MATQRSDFKAESFIPTSSMKSLTPSGRIKRVTVIRMKKHRDGSVSVSKEKMPVGVTVS